MTEERIAMIFAFLVCTLALYKLLFGVDIRRRRQRSADVHPDPNAS